MAGLRQSQIRQFQIRQSQNCLLVIPARRRSTRLPDKLLLRETGKTVLEHTFDAARQARCPGDVLVATDDAEIAAEARRFGARVVMTSPDCPSGTDRVAEARIETARENGDAWNPLRNSLR